MFMVQIIVFLLLTTSLGAMFFYTDVYQEVESGVVSVLCLSCIKLQPRTTYEYTFITATGQNHPDFVIKNLSFGPVLLHYSKDACPACDEMLPSFQKYFDIDFKKDEKIFQRFEIHNTTITYIYIYISNMSISETLRDSYKTYDKDNIGGLPMFTFITKEYHHGGEIKPFYTSIYATFEETESERLKFIDNMLKENIEIYNRNNP